MSEFFFLELDALPDSTNDLFVSGRKIETRSPECVSLATDPLLLPAVLLYSVAGVIEAGVVE